MSNYKVAGPVEVAGVKPGGNLTDEDLEGANIEALLAAGHIASVKTSKPAKAGEEQ